MELSHAKRTELTEKLLAVGHGSDVVALHEREALISLTKGKRPQKQYEVRLRDSKVVITLADYV